MRLVILATAALSGSAAALAQQPIAPENPVFVADSPVALEALVRAREMVAAGNVDQAARQLQRLLDTEPSALAPVEGESVLYVPLRTRIHEMLLEQPALLQRYRALYGAAAEDMVAQGGLDRVERSYFLTPAGLTATTRLVNEQIDRARFKAAFLTLEPLRAHPDAPKQAAVREAAERLSRYLRTPELEELCRQWGGQPAGAISQAPASAVHPVFSPLGVGQPGVLGGDRGQMVAKPLWSAAYADEQAAIEKAALNTDTADQVPPTARELRSFPVATADAIYATSGRVITAFDRLTLRTLWRSDPLKLVGVEEAPERDPGNARFRRWQSFGPEDIASVTVTGDFVLASPGADRSGGEEGVEQLTALDARTGELRWSRRVDEYDAQLARSHVRGALLEDEGTVVVSCRKASPERRLTAVYLIGVDLYTGDLKWTAMMGSAGSLPYMRSTQICDGGVVDAGIVYRVDRVGVLGAYQVASGRPVWVRRYSPEAPGDSTASTLPWDMNVPVVAGPWLYVLAPNGASIDRIDRRTGRAAASLPTADFGVLSYLVLAGDRLVAVAEDRLVVIELSRFGEPGAAAARERFAKPGIRGRVAVVGNRLAVPLAGGVAVVDPADAAGRPRVIDLDSGGNVLALDEQLVVADDARLHAYFDWTTADACLTRMIERSPRDLGPPAALAEFSYRAGRSDRMIFAVDAARAAMNSAPKDDALESQRARLVQVLQTAIDQFQRPSASNPAPPVPADQIAALIERLGELASGPSDRAAYLLMLGLSQQRASRLPEAIGTYQRILADSELLQSSWDPRGVGTQAGGEATRRIESLVREHGVGVYAAFESQAAEAAAKLPADAPLGELESLARRYPLASTSPSLWLRIAGAYQQQGLPRAEARALELGLQSAARLPRPPASVGELGGRLVENLRKRNLLAAAGDMLRRYQQKFDAVPLTVAGAPLDPAQLKSMMAQELANQRRWPRVGVPTASAAKPQALVGWGLMEEGMLPTRGSNPWFLVMQHEDGRVGLFGRKPGAENSEALPLEPLWISKGDTRSTLLRVDQRSALLYVQTETSGLVQRVDAATGTVAWRGEPFASYFPQHPQPPSRDGRFAGFIATPMDGQRPVGEQLIATDDHSLAMVERTGRAVSLDADSGQLLWSANLPIHRVFDTDVIGGQLIVAGDRDVRGPGGALVGATPVVLVVDARAGSVVREINPTGGPIRRVRFTERGDLILLLSTSVVCIDPENGQTVWRIAQQPAGSAVEAWVLGERVLLMAEDRSLWQAALADGQLAPGPLESRGRFDAASWRAFVTSRGSTAFATSQGVVLFDASGALVGVDALNPADNLLPAAMTDRSILLMSTTSQPARVPREGDVYTLYAINSDNGSVAASAPLLLGAIPQRIAVLDGRVAVTAGHTTVVYPAPAEGH